MTFKMEFKTDNTAFEENIVSEFDYIMDTICDLIAGSETQGIIHDTNGNAIGKWELNHDSKNP